MLSKIVLLCALCALVAARPWSRVNNPKIMSSNLKFGLAALRSAQLPTKPWSDTYWPSYQSGIAHRWLSSTPNDFKYRLNTLDQLKAMSADALKVLSPAEKYDIYLGRYDYPLVNSEWKRTSPSDASWEGLCHGWSPASYTYQQPNPATVVSKDGITLQFGSSDVKALLTYYAGQYDTAANKFLGGRCNTDLDMNTTAADAQPECWDTNPGAFHVVATNLLAQNAAFVYDRDRSIMVWNQPVYSISVSQGAVTSSYANVSVGVTFAVETVPMWQAHQARLDTANYRYSLDLDDSKNVVGGEYQSWDRGDFMWTITLDPFHGYFQGLADIYANATGDNRSRHLAVARGFATLPLRAESEPRHSVLTTSSDSKRIIEFTRATSQGRASVAIVGNGANSGIELKVTKLDTERHAETIRVYEGADGEGALVAVLHGALAAGETETVRINARSAFVLYTYNAHARRAAPENDDAEGFVAEVTLV
jgi:hypothetical protein